jgi:hypothetical protein
VRDFPEQAIPIADIAEAIWGEQVMSQNVAHGWPPAVVDLRLEAVLAPWLMALRWLIGSIQRPGRFTY